MPKASPLQASFSAGEVSALVQGRVDNERYKTALDTCLNYLPTVQGPLLRAPGTKYVTNVKDSSKPPAFIAFQFSQLQNYILEFGDQYIRFYTNNGQILASTSRVRVNAADNWYSFANIYGVRPDSNPKTGESIVSTSAVVGGSILELTSPYSYVDVNQLKYAQKDDTLYIVHSSYPQYKLQRFGSDLWDLKQVLTQDGPYLPINSYKTISDSAPVSLVFGAPVSFPVQGGAVYAVKTGAPFLPTTMANNGAGAIRVTGSSHGRVNGDRVFISGTVGTVEANNGTSSISAMSWPVNVINANSFDLLGSTFSNAYVGSAVVLPALFQPFGTPSVFSDVGRSIGLINQSGGRTWGRITSVSDMAHATVILDSTSSVSFTGTSALNVASNWQMGVWSLLGGYPQAVCFHQDRLGYAGTPGYPQRIDLSMTAQYESFASSGSSLIVADNNACSYNLSSDQLNTLYWLKSTQQGLLAGSLNSEWKVSPSNQATALTPTNVTAAQTSFFGSANIDAVQSGNATLYMQKGSRKLREMNYFFQVDTFRSTDLAELSEHITAPSVTRLAIQKETQPILWALRSDGVLASMTYNRDDQTLKVGWARRQLGGQSDSAGTAPAVKTIAVIPAPTGSYDQLWMAVQRYINGTSVVTVEYSTRVFDSVTRQDDAFQVDCGGTYDSPLTVTNITNTGSAVVTVAAHGLISGNSVRFKGVAGLNSSTVDINGVSTISNLVNEKTFQVASATVNAFYLQDFNGSFIDSRSYGAYFSGGEVRKLVSTISGLTWLKGETVGVLADGGIHPSTVVASSGVLTLSYPAAKVQIGYNYNSDGKTLRPEAGSADGSSIGKTRRPTRVAFMLNSVGDFNFGTSFDRLTPINFPVADNQLADNAAPLFSGIYRDGLESAYDFEGQVCWRQNSPLPGIIQTITVMMDEFDV